MAAGIRDRVWDVRDLLEAAWRFAQQFGVVKRELVCRPG
jgi:hypothetical protein